MKYYGVYDNDGYYIGFYPTDLWDEKDIPLENRIELTKDQWQQAITSRCKVVDGLHVVIQETEEQNINKKYIDLRNKRDKLLFESDWTQMPDSPLTDDQKRAWSTYRQSLRDLPSTVDINNIVYPEKPL